MKKMVILLSAGACIAASNHWECLFQWKIALEITHKSCLIFRQYCILRGVVSLFYFFRTSRLQPAGWVVVDTEHQQLYRNTVRWVVHKLQFRLQISEVICHEMKWWAEWYPKVSLLWTEHYSTLLEAAWGRSRYHFTANCIKVAVRPGYKGISINKGNDLKENKLSK